MTGTALPDSGAAVAPPMTAHEKTTAVRVRWMRIVPPFVSRIMADERLTKSCKRERPFAGRQRGNERFTTFTYR
jgi:hypothetical protein